MHRDHVKRPSLTDVFEQLSRRLIYLAYHDTQKNSQTPSKEAS